MSATRWGDYEIFTDQPLGQGGMGTVYKGRQVSLDRLVAIKVLKKDFVRDEEFVQRFHREAALLAKLVDSHIVQVYGAGEGEGEHFYAMEYVEGETLAAHLRRGRAFGPADLLKVALGAALALEASWKQRIVHRDIKPSNIIITQDGRIKVMDFGLAKAPDLNLTQPETVLGTAPYMSPEQAVGGPADISGDLYALGAVLYEMATGRPPFTGETSASVLYQHVHKLPTPPRRISPSVPEAIEAVILRLLAKAPRDRYPTPTELIADLKRLLEGSSPEARSAPIRHRKPDRRARMGELAAAAGLVTDTEIQKALALQKDAAEPLGKILENKGLVTDEQLRALVRLQQSSARTSPQDAALRECGNCFESVPADSEKCPRCGNIFGKIEIATRCPVCRNDQAVAGEYCARCGAHIPTGLASPREKSVKCPKCGRLTAARQDACAHCGYVWDATSKIRLRRGLRRVLDALANFKRLVVFAAVLVASFTVLYKWNALHHWVMSSVLHDDSFVLRSRAEGLLTALQYADDSAVSQLTDGQTTFPALFQELLGNPPGKASITEYSVTQVTANGTRGTVYADVTVLRGDAKPAVPLLGGASPNDTRRIALTWAKRGGQWYLER